MVENKESSLSKRRTFIKQTLAASVGAAILPSFAKSITLSSGLKIHFLGYSHG